MKNAWIASFILLVSIQALGEVTRHDADEGIARPLKGAPYISGGPYTRYKTLTDEGAALSEFCDLLSFNKRPSDDPLNYGRLRAVLLRDSNLPVELYARPYSIDLSRDAQGNEYITIGDAKMFSDESQPNRTEEDLERAGTKSWLRIHYSCKDGKVWSRASVDESLVKKSLQDLKSHLKMEEYFRSSQLTRPENALLYSLSRERLAQLNSKPESISEIERGQLLEILASVVRLNPKLRKDLRSFELKTNPFPDGVNYTFTLKGSDSEMRFGDVTIGLVNNSNEVRSLTYSRFQ